MKELQVPFQGSLHFLYYLQKEEEVSEDLPIKNYFPEFHKLKLHS